MDQDAMADAARVLIIETFKTGGHEAKLELDFKEPIGTWEVVARRVDT